MCPHRRCLQNLPGQEVYPMKPQMDLRQFRFSRLRDPQFRHLNLLAYWLLFGLAFLILERFSPVTEYHPVSCALDAYIPFLEIFLFPYLFWFVYLVGMHVYTAIYDVASFRRLMRFIIISYTLTTVIYILYPTCQELRPESFLRDNALTRFIAWFYTFDTHTNVCPSLHVIGSVAVACTAWNARGLNTPFWRVAFWAAAVLISISTVFMRQHSVVDVVLAVPVCILAAWLSRRKTES